MNAVGAVVVVDILTIPTHNPVVQAIEPLSCAVPAVVADAHKISPALTFIAVLTSRLTVVSPLEVQVGGIAVSVRSEPSC